ncbi:unnamed protein product [Rotaria sordida]|uniref:Uncharacterized protein n=1 Tax=Rotaria sordida TaxID=392033 RepID=A0A814F7Q4_9BILA|nr:unnamed protein product [Rotaria sordida]CAF4033731.1 unnamed protein product [Rotaria sordida]
MLNKLVNNRLSFAIFIAKRSAIIKSNANLGDQMKLLNNKKEFKKSLELFDKYKEKNNIEKCSNCIIIQVLKACTEIGDLKHGSNIHNLISPRLKYDPYVLPSLIHLYSKFIQ